MFKYLAQILKTFTPAQRIIALLILVFTIVTVTLGPSMIDRNTTNCSELEVRVKSQEAQILQLTSRVEQLNSELLQDQQQCTDNLIQKQQEIMGLVNGMIAETQTKCRAQSGSTEARMMVKQTEPEDPNEPRLAYSFAPPDRTPEKTDDQQTLEALKKLKAKLQKTMIGQK